MAETIDGTVQVVTFLLGDESYGINIMDVKEIYPKREIRPLPNAPVFLEGLLNLRGKIFPIINPHKRFNIQKKKSFNDETGMVDVFIILQVEENLLGLMVDKVLKVVTLEEGQMQPPPQLSSGINSEYIQGVVRGENGEYLIIIDVKKLFDPEELKQITSAIKS